MGVPKFPKLGLLRFCGPITLCEDLQLRWGLKKNYSPGQELFNDMLHVTYMQGNLVNSWFLMVGSQTTNLTPDLSFGHNLYFKCPNESWEFILDIYISISFQWYKEIFNPLGFDPCNCFLKIWKSTGIPNSQGGSSLGSVKVHSLTLSFILGLLLGPQPCKPLLWSWAQS